MTNLGNGDIIALSQRDNFDHSQKKTGQRQIIALPEDESLLNLGYLMGSVWKRGKGV